MHTRCTRVADKPQTSWAQDVRAPMAVRLAAADSVVVGRHLDGFQMTGKSAASQRTRQRLRAHVLFMRILARMRA